MKLWSLIDTAVDEALKAHPDYLTPKGAESARKLIVRKVTGALRDAAAPPKQTAEEQAAAKAAPPSEFFSCECWSRAWWALLIAKIERQQPTAFMMQFAGRAQKGTLFNVPAAEAISDDDLVRFSSYPSTGDAVKAWRTWFTRHGVTLPEWRERVWVFLPSPDPPNEAALKENAPDTISK